MANKIDILIKAKDEASKEIEGVTGSLKDLEGGAEDLKESGSKSFGDFMDNVAITMLGINQAIEIGIKAFDLLKGAYEATVGKTLEIAEEIEQLSRISGEAPENMSALRVEAEKSKVPFEDLYKAMENLNKNGVAPTIENLVAIADEYVNLQDPIDKAKFLTENFGAAGDEIAPMLEAIAGGVEAVNNAGLIFTEEEIQAANDYEAAVADLDLAWDNLKTTIGTAVIPALTDVFNQISDSSTISILREQLNDVAVAARDAGQITKEEYNAIMLEAYDRSKTTGDAIEFLGSAIDDLSVGLNAEKDAAVAVSKAHDDLIMSIFNESASWSGFKQAMDEAGLSMGMITEDIYNSEKAAQMTAAELAALNTIDIEDKEFTVKALIDTSAVDEWDAPAKFGTVTYTPRGGEGLFAAGGLVQAAASGLAATLPHYWVGERGPEPFFPSADGRIVSNTQAMSALRGGAQADARQIADAVKQGVREGLKESGGGNVYNLTMPTSNNPADVRTAFELMEAWGA